MLAFREFLVLGRWSEGFVSTKIALQVNKLEVERFGDRQGDGFLRSPGDENQLT